jgi:predicted amidohydrolase
MHPNERFHLEILEEICESFVFVENGVVSLLPDHASLLAHPPVKAYLGALLFKLGALDFARDPAHWRILTTARALENTIYVAAADHAPPVGAGNSMVVDPMGVEVVTVGEQTDVAIAWISRERIAAVRRLNPALRLRRFAVTERPHPDES